MYRVGAAKKDITPETDENGNIKNPGIYVWGFFDEPNRPSDPATKVLDKLYLYSRALVIRHVPSNHAVLLISLDLGALEAAFTAQIREHVHREYGLAPECVMVAVTHTHFAPVVVSLDSWPAPKNKPNEEYMAFLWQRTIASIDDAFAMSFDMECPTARLTFFRGEMDLDLAWHRWLPGGTKPYDRTVDVLVARNDDVEKKIIATLFTFGCHPLCYYSTPNQHQISAGFPGKAAEKIETGGGVALFCQGYGGTVGMKVHDAEHNGKRLGEFVKELIERPPQEISGGISAATHILRLPFKLVDNTVLEKVKKNPYAFSTEKSKLVALWAENVLRRGNQPASLRVELQTFQIGDFPNHWRLVASGHEVCTEFSDPIRKIRPYERVTLVAYCNEQISYLPTDEMINVVSNFPSGLDGHFEGSRGFVNYGHRANPKLGVDRAYRDAHEALYGPWKPFGEVPKRISAMAVFGSSLYAITSDGRLLTCDLAVGSLSWRDIGEASGIAGLASASGKLFRATKSDGGSPNSRQLQWWCPVACTAPEWQRCNHANDVDALAGDGEFLWVADGRLKTLTRRPAIVGQEMDWKKAGPLLEKQTVLTMAAAHDRLFSISREVREPEKDGHVLYWRPAKDESLQWTAMGIARRPTALAAIGNKLYLATEDLRILVHQL